MIKMVETYNNTKPSMGINLPQYFDRSDYAPPYTNQLNSALTQKGYEERNFLGAVVFWGLAGLLVGYLIGRNNALNPEAQRILRENKKEENASDLESSLDKEGISREEGKKTLSSLLALSMYSPKALKEKTEKKDYSAEEYSKELERLKAESGENYIKAGKETKKVGNNKIDNSEAEENYEIAAVNKETENFNKKPENIDEKATDTNSEKEASQETESNSEE